jgi:subtilisin family serine protease
VSGRNKVGANWRYTTVKYAQWYHPLTFTTGVNGSPISVENRILVKFNKDILNQTLLNNRDLAYINPNQLLTTVAYNRLKNAVPFDLVNSKIIRLSTLTPSDTFSISRSGVKIKIPPIWASFAIDYPNLATKNEANVSRSLDTLFPMIIYSHPDYVGKLDNDANDSYYNSSTIKQLSLFPNDYYLNPSEDTTQININEAWDYELGSQNIKIGVIDGFISHENIDLDLKGGYDYILKSPLINTQNPFNANSIHGTAVAGIIGAKRNNFINIAGIAGGEYNPQSGSAKPGVSIYGYRISSNNSPSTLIVSNAFSAITEHLYNTPSYQHDYMNLMNNSWGVNQGEIPNYQIDLLEEAVHQANRDQVTFVASRGNSPSQEDIHYPGIFYDNWVLSVGASGIDGKLADSLNTCNDPFNSSYGKGMDIIAPGAICKIVTLNGMSDNNTPPAYGYFSQTSAAAPHASGVAALLLSHYHGLVNSSDLAPEDIEYVLQVSSKDRYTKGYDDKSGWGFLDAGAAFRLANKTHHHFEHICNNADSNQITIKVDSANLNKIVYLSRKVQQDSSLCGNNIWFNKGNYKVDRFIIQSKYTLSPNGKDRVKGVWGLHSQSNTYYSDSTLNEILPFEQIKCCDTSKTGINTVLVKAFGYIYRVKDSLTGNTIGWLPFDTTCAKLKAKLCIGVLYEDTLHPPVVNSIQRIVISDDEMKIYPNPSDERITIEIKSSNELETSIDLYDVTGKLIKRIFNGLMKEGINKYTYSIEDLSNGIYYLKLTNVKQSTSTHFIKI